MAVHLPTTPDIRDCVVIIRAAGERTESACVRIVADQMRLLGGDPSTRLHVVHERPFSRALQRTYELGIASGAAWVIAMDADVLLLQDGLARILEALASLKPDGFTITPLVLCRFFHGYCFRGLHLYPAHLLPSALAIMDACGAHEHIRPESCVVLAMERAGHGYQATTLPVGVHDFEQAYHHIYVKMRMRGRRECADDGGKSLDRYIALMKSLADLGDHDARVAAWGLEDGAADARAAVPPPPHYDWLSDYPELNARLSAAGIRTKPALNDNLGDTFALDRMLGFDYLADTRTPKWIKDLAGFSDGLQRVRENFRLYSPSAVESTLIPRSQHAQHAQPLRT
ncbi:MAG: hypothetical protein K2W85_03645 [Phycisphaerales bacterium]|nr:hypothetical protein [Phycisphaerales bacterium]